MRSPSVFLFPPVTHLVMRFDGAAVVVLGFPIVLLVLCGFRYVFYVVSLEFLEIAYVEVSPGDSVELDFFLLFYLWFYCLCWILSSIGVYWLYWLVMAMFIVLN